MACMANPVQFFPSTGHTLRRLPSGQVTSGLRHMNISAMHGKSKDDGGLNFRQEPLVVQLAFSDVIFLNTLLNNTDFYTTEYKYMEIG